MISRSELWLRTVFDFLSEVDLKTLQAVNRHFDDLVRIKMDPTYLGVYSVNVWDKKIHYLPYHDLKAFQQVNRVAKRIIVGLNPSPKLFTAQMRNLPSSNGRKDSKLIIL